MRINKFVAMASGLSRRATDTAIVQGRVKIDGLPALLGNSVEANMSVSLDDKILTLPERSTIIILNKPVGYVCSRSGQGSKTIYELLPEKFKSLKPVGRLDKDSSGLILLTNDGTLAQQLTHPKFQKIKVYELELNRPLDVKDKVIIERGVQLKDGLSRLQLKKGNSNHRQWQVTMSEGRNRQIRRTFQALNYQVTSLNRTRFHSYNLGLLEVGQYLQAH